MIGRSACFATALMFSAQVVAQRATIVPPPMQFDSAEAHYNYLLEQAGGGTQHTQTSLPDWSGIWAGDRLVTWTLGVMPADYFRGHPENSAELQGGYGAIRLWRVKRLRLWRRR